jgi:putative SOS response-associated peptidase YedK
VHARPGGGEPDASNLLWVAGLFDSTTRSFTLLTADAPPSLQWLHDRVPVLLDQVRRSEP